MIKALLEKIRYFGYTIPVISLLILFYIWNTTNPATVGPAGILAVFVILYVFWVSLFFMLFHLAVGLYSRSERLKVLIGSKKRHRYRQDIGYYIASVLAFVPVLVLAMQSVNQLTLRDIVLVFLLTGLAIFYIIKRS